MAVLGLLIAMVGIDPVRGAPRFTFGIPSLYDGVGFIPVVMGLFGVAEILLTVERPYRQVVKTNLASLLPSREDWRRSVGAIGRGTGVGFFLVDTGCQRHHPTFVAYILEKRLSKRPEVRPGRHRRRGGARTANNAYASIDDPLHIGHRDSPTIAVLMGAFSMASRSLPLQGAA